MERQLPRKVLQALKSSLPSDRVKTDQEVLTSYSYDASFIRGIPSVVVFPETEDEVLRILKVADEFVVPVYARGAGTSTTGSCVPVKGGILISFSRMNRILELNQEERIVRVQPGVLNGELNDYLKKFGLFYPPDPASYKYSTIGGNVATGAGGPRCFKYGTTKDYVLALRVALPGGKLLQTAPSTLKFAAGYNLTPIFVGSEGTLGIFTEIVLKVIPLPPKRALFVIPFYEEKLALEFITKLITSGITPACAEFIDKTTLKAISLSKWSSRLNSRVKGVFEAILLVEVDGDDYQVKLQVDAVKELLKSVKVEFSCSEDPQEMEEMWELRRIISPALRALGEKKISDDIVVPRRYMIDLLEKVRELEARYGLPVCAFGHAGDGNFHINILFSKEQESLARELRLEVIKRVLSLKGTISGEHGIGYAKKPLIRFELDPVNIEVSLKLKQVFDPKGILSPGVKLPSEYEKL